MRDCQGTQGLSTTASSNRTSCMFMFMFMLLRPARLAVQAPRRHRRCAAQQQQESSTAGNKQAGRAPGLPMRTTRSLPASRSLLLKSDSASRMKRAR